MELKFTQHLLKALAFSKEEAQRTGSWAITPDHFLLGLIREGHNSAIFCLEEMGLDLKMLKKHIDKIMFQVEPIPFDDLDNIDYSRNACTVFNYAALEAANHGNQYMDAHHLLLGIARTDTGAGPGWLRQRGTDYLRLKTFMEANSYLTADEYIDHEQNKEVFYHEPSSNTPEDEEIGKDGRNWKEEENWNEEKNGMENEKWENEGKWKNEGNLKNKGNWEHEERPEDNDFRIEDYGFDLTELARNGKLDPVVGRDNEIGRIMEIITRRKKNSTMLVGDPGVGKSSVIEGLALRIANGEVPSELKDKKIISLDIASVVAGTKYRGEFEKRFKAIIDKFSNDDSIILFIDEFHNIIGAGSSSGSLDAANMLKPALARGEIQCIAATTLDEYTKIVEKDKALDRRFQKVQIKSADIPYTIDILTKLKPYYESHHDVIYMEEAIRACATLSDRYIPFKCLPDKALDAMDEAGAMKKLQAESDTSDKAKTTIVTPDDIATVISRTTGIPVNKITESEGHRLLMMQERLKNRVIGQDEAVETVVRAIQRGRAGIKDPNRPIGSFLFFGPTGVGKTHLAKTIAELLFDSADNIIRLDMSEYMEKINVTRLIGAPPGYVGFEEGGQLSEQVRRKPYSVVLLDEIEKAHHDVFNLLLQVIDEGRLTDSNGRTVDFRNTILIMTSNVGSRELEEYGNGVGFHTLGSNARADKKAILDKAVKKEFPPEFINRVDEQIFFNSLTKDNISRIIDIELEGLHKRVREAGFRLKISPTAKKFVAEAGYDPKFGARPLRRAVQRYIENPVSEFIINQRINGFHKVESNKETCIKIGFDSKNGTTKINIDPLTTGKAD